MGSVCGSKSDGRAIEGREGEAIEVPSVSSSSAGKGTTDEERLLASRRKAELDEQRSQSFWSGLESDDQSEEHTLEWLNAIIEVVYPRFNKAMRAEILPMVQQEVTSKITGLSGVSAITINSFDFGSTPPVVGPLDVSKRSVATGNGQAIEIRWKLRWESDCDINMKIATTFKEFTMGLTKLSLSGEVTALLCPIMKVLPCVAAVQVYMVSPPTLDFQLQGTFRSMGDGMAQLLTGFVRNGVLKAFQQQIVEPNRMMILTPVVKLFQGKLEMNASTKVDDPTSLKHPRPEILAEIGAIEAKGLTAKDWNMSGGSSDPYAVIRLGACDFRTKTIKKNVNPVWGKEGFGDFLVFNMRQQVQVEVQDDDTLQDDLIGRLPPLTFGEFAKRSPEDWYDIFEAKPPNSKPPKNPAQLATDKGQGDGERAATGKVKIGFSLFAFSSDPETVKNPPKKKTKGTSFMQVQVKCLRGLSEEHARGAKVNVKVEGENNYTKGSKYVASKNRSDADATSQRLAEHLILEEHEAPETVAKVSGLDLETVHAIIRQKPSFTCRWFEGLDIVLEDAMKARIEVEVELKGGGTLRAQPPLMMVSHLLQAPDMTFDTTMRLDDVSEGGSHSKGLFSSRLKVQRAHTDPLKTTSSEPTPGTPAKRGSMFSQAKFQSEPTPGTPAKRGSMFSQAAHATGMDKVIDKAQHVLHLDSRDSEIEHHEVYDLEVTFSLYGLTPYRRELLEPASPGTSPKLAI